LSGIHHIAPTERRAIEQEEELSRMKIKTAVAAVVIILLSCAPRVALAQQQQHQQPGAQSQEVRELREEVRRLREEQEAMRKELRELRQILERAGVAKPAPPEFISVDDDPAQGSDTARVVMIDFSDYQ